MDKICIYLRKSRADEELEKTLGEGETLSKHRNALLKYAKEKQLNIVEIKEEIVSGESLFHRPKMLELLKEVENKEYTGVLVMDMQRLGRGDMQDQGIILKTFKDSNTKIITPQKTYDLNNDFDEEYSEFEAFMSRKELKMINRRMQGGRVRSVEEGNYIATNAPYGYDIEVVKRSRTLRINQDESHVVKLIFEMYCSGKGAGAIAEHLNALGYKTKVGRKFSNSSVLFILRNPIYIGKITWKKKDIRKSKDPNKAKDTRTRDKSEWMVVEGKHNAIIDTDTFNRANDILNKRYHIPYKLANGPANPLAGVVVCSVCKSKMVLRKLRGVDRIMCTKKCGNKSIKFEYLEDAIMEGLEEQYRKYKFEIENEDTAADTKAYEKQLVALRKEFETLNEQKLSLFDFLERKIYTEEIFLQRSKNLDKRMKDVQEGIDLLNEAIENESRKIQKATVVKFKNVPDAYKKTNDIQEKNDLIKSVLAKVEYSKSKEQRNDDFNIKLFPYY